MDNKYYIVRGQSSGVFFGQVRERNGKEVVLVNVRKLKKEYGIGCDDAAGRRINHELEI